MYSDGEDEVVVLGSQRVCLMGKCGAAVAAPQDEEDAVSARGSWLMSLSLQNFANMDSRLPHWSSTAGVTGNVGLVGWLGTASPPRWDAMCQGGFELVRAASGDGEHSVTEGRGLGRGDRVSGLK